MAIQFQHDYKLLELEPAADWNNANKNYRRLVHVWHPDRYMQRPRERVHAQQKFIELTKAFNNLRTFYRENDRMPFEKIKRSTTEYTQPSAEQQIKPKDGAVSESSILNKRKPSTKHLKPRVLKPMQWIVPAVATVAAGVLVFVVIDRNVKLNAIEEAKRVLGNVQPSEFMANSEEITKVRMGDAIAKDIFK